MVEGFTPGMARSGQAISGMHALLLVVEVEDLKEWIAWIKSNPNPDSDMDKLDLIFIQNIIRMKKLAVLRQDGGIKIDKINTKFYR